MSECIIDGTIIDHHYKLQKTTRTEIPLTGKHKKGKPPSVNGDNIADYIVWEKSTYEIVWQPTKGPCSGKLPKNKTLWNSSIRFGKNKAIKKAKKFVFLNGIPVRAGDFIKLKNKTWYQIREIDTYINSRVKEGQKASIKDIDIKILLRKKKAWSWFFPEYDQLKGAVIGVKRKPNAYRKVKRERWGIENSLARIELFRF